MSNSNNLGLLIARLSLGGMLLLHGYHKLIGGIGGISTLLENNGLPGFLAYGVLIGEVLAPLLLIIGYQTRLAAWLIVVNMGFAIALVHRSELLQLNAHGGWAIELQAFYLLTALIVALTGPGRFALRSSG